MTDDSSIHAEGKTDGRVPGPAQICPMCGAAIQVVARRCKSCGEVLSRLVRRSRLQRAVEVILPEGTFLVEYIGSRIGYEMVQVQPGKVFRKASLLWFVPRFDFHVGRSAAVVEVRVAPWLAVRFFSLRINDILFYED
jgi:hypothetical protein